MCYTCVQNSPSTYRPSFSAVNQVVTLTRVTSERVVMYLLDLLQVSSGQFMCCGLSLS